MQKGFQLPVIYFDGQESGKSFSKPYLGKERKASLQMAASGYSEHQGSGLVENYSMPSYNWNVNMYITYSHPRHKDGRDWVTKATAKYLIL